MANRYFIGLTLPDSLSGIIADAQKQSVSSKDLMKPIVPHITLLDPNTLNKVDPSFLLPKIKKIAPAYLPIKIKLASFGSFEDRVLFIKADSPGLQKLQAELTNLLPDDIRTTLSNRPFKPHVTLAQAKPYKKIAGDLEQSFKHKLKDLLPATFELKHLSLFTWQKPRTYTAEVI